MWLVLCSPADHAALWAARRLRAVSDRPVELVSPEELLCARTWEHRVSCRGRVESRVVLQDGRELHSAAIGGVLNRLDRLPCASLRAASPADRVYAEQEWTALLLSWLASLRGVLNPPLAQGLVGTPRDAGFWAWQSARVGLPLHSGGAGSISHAVVFDDAVFGKLPGDVTPALLQLATLAQTPLLGVALARGAAGWHFHSATAFPDLRLGGEEMISALARRWSTTAAHPLAAAAVTSGREP